MKLSRPATIAIAAWLLGIAMGVLGTSYYVKWEESREAAWHLQNDAAIVERYAKLKPLEDPALTAHVEQCMAEYIAMMDKLQEDFNEGCEENTACIKMAYSVNEDQVTHCKREYHQIREKYTPGKSGATVDGG